MNHPTRYDLPHHSWKALHSEFWSWMLELPHDVAAPLLRRLHGDASFPRFMLAIHDYRTLNVSTVIADDEATIGVAIPVTDGPDRLLFTVTNTDIGVDVEWLLAAAAMRMTEELDELLDSRESS